MQKIYLIYDEYNPPYLVELINRLLKDDSSAIEEILNYKNECKNIL